MCMYYVRMYVRIYIYMYIYIGNVCVILHSYARFPALYMSTQQLYMQTSRNMAHVIRIEMRVRVL